MTPNSFAQEKLDSTFLYYNTVTLLIGTFCHGSLVNLWQVLAKGKGAYACQLIYLKKIVMEGVGTTGVD